MENKAEYAHPGELVKQAKLACLITKPNDQMTDDEIRTVIRALAEVTHDTTWVDGHLVFGSKAIDLMLFIALAEFPWFYEKYDLSQFD